MKDSNNMVASHAAAALDPLALSLTGRQVIEASAGTGKTWTLAALYVRMVLGHGRAGGGLMPPQILVMTFTEAATAELRDRIRARLAEAAQLFRAPASTSGDAFLRALRDAYTPAQWPHCAERLGQAAQWMDDAAIFTIHGWSSRMLRQHAFDSAALFEQSMVEHGDDMKLEATQDYWRRHFYPLPKEQLARLATLASSPEDLLNKLKPCWANLERGPAPAVVAGVAAAPDFAGWAAWHARTDALTGAIHAAWNDELVELIWQAASSGHLKRHRDDWMTSRLKKMAQWKEGADIDAGALKHFCQSTLRASGWLGAAEHAVFAQIEALRDHLADAPDFWEQLEQHAAFEIDAAYRGAKAELGQFDFSDLLQSLYHALQNPDGRLAAAIAQQYPIAMVDEFQDTDPWQYGALSAIYGATRDGATALLMIGDPKQAIYSFRGADLDTYLRARDEAQAIHTLAGNFRSSRQVVNAVNHVFGQGAAPFGAIAFAPVRAANAGVLPLPVAGAQQPALTVWQLASVAPLSQGDWMCRMASLFASEMVALLNAGAATPGQMAVLVRSGKQASAIRGELARRGVRSVYLSESDSVYAGPEASELWRLLRAVAQPRSTALLRAALVTPLWGKSPAELERLFADEAAWDALAVRMQDMHTIWQRQGFLPMLHQWLHDESIPARLLARPSQGERSLTSLLHLGELLQAASLGLQGTGGLIGYLARHMRAPAGAGEAAQLRLESDADLVQVITMHKAKGLQYPLVFLPFAGWFRAKGDDTGGEMEEDTRLLYVALTRAERAIWLGAAECRGDVRPAKGGKSALSRLLQRTESVSLAQALEAWAACEDIAVIAAPAADDVAYRPPTAPVASLGALRPVRSLRNAWWSASYSGLMRGAPEPAHGAGLAAQPGAGELRLDEALIDSGEPQQDPVLAGAQLPPAGGGAAYDGYAGGARLGTLLHGGLEWQAQHGWPAAHDPADATWQAQLAQLAAQLPADGPPAALLGTWMREIVTTPLPLPQAAPLVLAQLQPRQVWAEMDFAMAVGGCPAAELDALVTRYVLPGGERPGLPLRQLAGMLKGSMDLVLEHAGRYYVLDYKSNRLPGYAAAQLRGSVLSHRYDVQYALYLLALHRLLKARLPDYDYERHVGGAIYLFLRGVGGPGAGVHADRPPRALIEALDTAFSRAGSPQELH